MLTLSGPSSNSKIFSGPNRKLVLIYFVQRRWPSPAARQLSTPYSIWIRANVAECREQNAHYFLALDLLIFKNCQASYSHSMSPGCSWISRMTSAILESLTIITSRWPSRK